MRAGRRTDPRKTVISDDLVKAVMVYGENNPLWELAQKSGMNSSVFSRILHKNTSYKVVPGDKRIIKIARMIGFDGKLFEDKGENCESNSGSKGQERL